jgi:hypothetical protein
MKGTIKMTPKTALPWHIGMKPGPIIYGPLGEQVADCRGLLDTHEACINTTYIVGACNAYPELIEALRYLAHMVGNENVPGNILKLLEDHY